MKAVNGTCGDVLIAHPITGEAVWISIKVHDQLHDEAFEKYIKPGILKELERRENEN